MSSAVAQSRYTEPWVAAPRPQAGPGGRWLDVAWPLRDSGTASLVDRHNLTVLFDGVLYNALELSRELSGPPESSFAALLAEAYRAWGTGLVHRLRGRFSFIIHDGNEGLTFAARDPLGAMPLFYTEAQGRVLVAPSVQALREQPGVNRAVNRAALAEHLCHSWADHHETFFEAIHRVSPGYMLVARNGSVRVTRYWEPTPLDRPVDWVDESEMQTRFAEAFERAVGRTLDWGPTGIFLSGGLDSISVAAVSADVARSRGASAPVALSLGFPGDSDEEKEQRGVAAKLGLEHVFVPFDEATPSSQLLTAALELTKVHASPILNPWMPAYSNLALRARRRGIQVITSGAGGDEWLAVSPFLAADMMRRGDVSGLWRFMRGWKRSYRLSPAGVAHCLLWQFGARPLMSAAMGGMFPDWWRSNRIARGVRGRRTWVAPDPTLAKALDERVVRTMPPPNPPGGFYLHDVRQSLEHPLTVMELDEIFEMGRRLEVHFLHPYWDADVVDILYRAPPMSLFADGRSKSAVRQTMAKRFPGLGLERQKKRSGTTFYTTVLQQEIPGLWSREQQDLSPVADLGIVDIRAARKLAEGPLGRQREFGYVNAWDLVNVNAWLRAHQ